jgi:adenosylcobinamide-GDP ribazoletransferase
MSGFWIALQFLTCLPVRLRSMPSAEQLGQSVLYYPLVGLLLGLLLLLASYLLAATSLPLSLQAALLLSLWVGLSGALHLDGLADSADAWVGGINDPQRTLAIMKDPCCGPVAVVVLVLIVLLKFTALLALLQQSEYMALLVVPFLGRGALLGVLLLTPYVRAEGLGEAMARHLPRQPAALILLMVCAAGLLLGGLCMMLAVFVTFVLLRRMMLKRLGGTTGDTAGALLEILECVALIVLVAS